MSTSASRLSFSPLELTGAALCAATLASIVTAIAASILIRPEQVVVAGPSEASPPPDVGQVEAPAAGGGEGPLEEVAVTKVERLVVPRVAKLATDNPHSAQWRDAGYVEVPILPQQMAMPTLAAASIDRVRLQGLTDGRRIAWRVSWADPAPDGNVDTGRFSDAVAIGFPLDAGAPPMMGAENLRLQILYWKALWQKDIDVGFQDVQDLHPNYWSDLYWFAEGEFPYPVPASFQHPAAKQWFVAHQAGNPMAAFSRSQPVEELVAEGWSTLTHQPHTATTGKGAWLNGRWAVVMTRPLTTTDPLDYRFATGGKGQIVCAVWQGGDENRGGRKHWSGWTDFEVAQ